MTGTPAEPGAADATGSAGVDPAEERLANLFAGLNEVIRAGEETRRLRAEMIRRLAAAGWTQDRLARLAGMSQPAVSKQVTRAAGPAGATAEPDGLALDQGDAPWLEGRLWGLAEEIADWVAASREPGGGAAHCARLTQALARGRKRFSERNVDALRRLVEEDLRTHRAVLDPRHQGTYDRIARALDTRATPGSHSEHTASARRTLARQIQRMRLREADEATADTTTAGDTRGC
ncbi:sigma-70 family RNA polymerase sigma factor [Streptomyces sp. NPDC046203]|uniref:sigma-70 family RNA polymerase sigma factor n=1 Tax=Streptomyces sp. NPDC046203 TaxID=3154602 RepID=UPI0033DCE1A1